MSEPMDPSTSQKASSDPMTEEWERRILCADESCIGTVGPDGKCRVCGRTHPGLVEEDVPVVMDPDAESILTGAEMQESAGSDEEDLAAEESDEWSERRLCPDESCIGTIGPDKKCRVCGRSDTKDH